MFAKIKPNTQIIGQNLVYFARLNSTNSLAIELFKNNLVENGTVICTDEQIAGRGQMQKEWVSNANENLLFSIILQPVTNVISDPFILNKCITLSLFQFIAKSLTDQDVKIKWPNDIMVNKRKIAGILVENSFSGHQLSISIVGVGLNVNQNFKEHPLYNATSLHDQANKVFDRAFILEKLLEIIDQNYFKLIKNETDFISAEFDQHLLGFDKESTFIAGNKNFRAKIIGCDSDGRLLLNKDHQISNYLHGEIQQIIE